MKHPPMILGWREWVGLPDLGVGRVKAKLDTGARSSALHAFDVQTFTRDGQEWASFEVHPLQDSRAMAVRAEAPLVEYRNIRSSSGHTQRRPVIRTDISIAGQRWSIELTLTRRDSMGFRMLLGRQTLRRHVLVDPSHSFQAGR